MEKQLSISSVPVMIGYLILGYYFCGECFEEAGNDLKISNGMSVTRIAEQTIENLFKNTAYGYLWIESKPHMLIKWKFKINLFGIGYYASAHIYIGIVNRDDRLNEDFGKDEGAEYFKITPEELDENGYFRLKLDTKKKILSTRNGEYRNPKIKIKIDSDTRYKLAVSLCGEDAKITLVDFKKEAIP